MAPCTPGKDGLRALWQRREIAYRADMDAAALPIDAVLTELLTALEQAPCAILAAPPGAGKTTRVPLAMLDAPWRDGRKIVMLEPRRIAARAAAERLADGLGERPGARVGYRIRGESVAGRAIEVVTEGVLTRMLHADPSLDGIAAVLFDEAHERSIHGDLGLALALEAQEALRPDLRLVVMSATLDVAAFAAVMRDPPVIESQGRAYPVETRWRDRPWRRPGQGRRGLEQAAADLVARALAETGPDGDLLACRPGALPYAGTHTAVGEAVGRAVWDAVRAGAADWIATGGAA